MRIKRILIVSIIFLVLGCSGKNKNRVAEVLEIPEPGDWILVIHPEGCKTCLDQLYQELSDFELANGVIVIVAKNTKTMRLNPLFQQSSVPIYLDEEKKLITEGIVDLQDQILLFSADGVEAFEILNYESLFTSLGNK
ncbi:hypothetical protein [Algoriphagus aquimarinus]|uniref:hypothetical protein n=1 Tax=Algoriphagus aquimarinus TaxID=237018 RepID=UPI0030D83426|tara:strand:+ start:1341 stop:1754 length:414 start_codon:yes stop_codon:yes gene_type:complete